MNQPTQLSDTRQNFKPEVVAKIPKPILLPLRLFFYISGYLAPKLATNNFEKLLQAMPRKPLKEKEIAFLNTAKRQTFNCGDVDLQGYIFGEGPTVLMVHGLLGNAANYRAMIPKLVENGFRVVAFDAANHGNSPDGVAFSDQPVRHLKVILRQLGEVHGIVSHSAGTYAALIAQLDDSSGCNLKKCVYMAAFPDAKVTLLTFMDYFWVPRRLFDRLAGLFEVIGGMPFEQQSFAYCLPRHAVDQKPQRLFIHCRDDRHIPYFRTEEMLLGDPDAELYSTDQLGHFKILRDEAVTDKVVDFMKL